MSEGNERNLESVAPEAAERAESENIEKVAPEAESAAPETKSAEPEAETAEAAPESKAARRDEADAPKRAAGRKRGHGAVVPLAIALVVALVIFGILVGYGMGRVRGQRAQEVEAEPTAAVEQEDPAFDGFTEELTNQNQMALDALAGEDEAGDEAAAALMGEEDFLADATDEAAASVVVAEYGDGQTLTSGEVLEAYNEELSSYILAGFSEDEVAETLLDEVLETMVSDRVLEEHAREMGVYELSDDDRTQIEAEADAAYEDLLRYYMVGSGDGEGEDARSAAEAALLDAEGITREYLVAQMEQDWWKSKLYDALTDSVSVSGEDVQALYDTRLEEQRENFTEYPEDYEFSQSNGETILFNLPGYRAVKSLLLGFDDDEAAMAVFSLTDELFAPEEGEAEEDEEAEAQRQAQLDAYYEGPEARAKQALEELRGGADMDEMILSIGQDEGMKDERQREMGYYVSASSTLWSEDFTAAAMALENVGDYSEPVRTEDGVCILQYLGDVPEGEVPLSDVRDALEEEALTAARDEAYQAQVDAWVAEANPSYYPERMQ